MTFRLVPKSVTVNDPEWSNDRFILRYFGEFGKHAFQHIGLIASICGGIYVRVYCVW